MDKKNLKFIPNIVLTALVVVCSIINFFNSRQGIIIFSEAVNIIVALLVILYAAIGYKKPHGNMLKNLILIYALSMIIQINASFTVGFKHIAVFNIAIMGLLAYVAGRLNKIKSNMVILSVVLVAQITSAIVYIMKAGTVNFLVIVGAFTQVIMLMNINAAYFSRHYEHKEAGVED